MGQSLGGYISAEGKRGTCAKVQFVSTLMESHRSIPSYCLHMWNWEFLGENTLCHGILQSWDGPTEHVAVGIDLGFLISITALHSVFIRLQRFFLRWVSLWARVTLFSLLQNL